MGVQCSKVLKLVVMASSYDDFGLPRRAHLGRRAHLLEVKISYLLVTRVDFGSVKHHKAVDDDADGCAVPYRSKIDHDGAWVSLSYHFSAGGAVVPMPIWSVEKWCRSTRSSSIRAILSTLWSYWDVVVGWVWLLRLVCTIYAYFISVSKRGQVVWDGGWYYVSHKGT